MCALWTVRENILSVSFTPLSACWRAVSSPQGWAPQGPAHRCPQTCRWAFPELWGDERPQQAGGLGQRWYERARCRQENSPRRPQWGEPSCS